MKKYIISVGNIGNIEADTRTAAEQIYYEYTEQSRSNYGRAAGEDIFMFVDGEIVKEYYGSNNNEPEYN